MTYIIIKGNKPTKYDKNRQVAKHIHVQESQLSGLSRSKGAQVGDFKLARDSHKQYKDYRRFNNPQDRKKIQSNIEQIRKEHQARYLNEKYTKKEQEAIERYKSQNG